MTLLQTASRVMSLAQGGHPLEALELGTGRLADAGDEPPLERAALWYAVAVAEHVRGDSHAQAEAAGRCLALAREGGEPGWASNALSMRAMALVRANTVEPALLDLGQAEVDLAACTDEGLRNWAHTGLGYAYLELRLYELAEPHFEAAQGIDASPLPFPESRTIDLLNLAGLHLRWADELDRAQPHEGSSDEAETRRARARAYAVSGCEEARRIGRADLWESCRALELCARPTDAADSVEELEQAWHSPDHRDHFGGRATVGRALARALWHRGRREEALGVARAAAEASTAAGDWQVSAAAQWLLVEMECEAGVPGAGNGREYGRLLSRVLWQQRLSTLQGATAALDVQHLRHDTLAAQRAAHEDPLTGAGNRRALAAALAEAEARTAVDHRPTSLLVVDLDGFKAVNDAHGHVVGDEGLRAVAEAIRSVARAEDLVARLGGDEFVVLAHGTDAEAAAGLTERVRQAIAEITLEAPTGPVRLSASVGARTTDLETSLTDLLAAADRAMYADKRSGARRTVTAER